MSTAEELFRAGDLKGCLAELQSEVRKRPADPKLRIFLAQLLMVTGDWDRAVSGKTAKRVKGGQVPCRIDPKHRSFSMRAA